MSKSRAVIINMLKVRGYKTPSDENDFVNSNEEEYLTYNLKDPETKLFVFFPKAPKVGIFTIRQYIKELEENNVNHAIIVVKESITAFAKQAFNEASPLVIEDFKESELKIDKLTHVLVPKHEILSDAEKAELLELYKAKESMIPKMVFSDAIRRYFGAKKGQIFKITRPSETAGEYIYYRIVC